ncbi:ABC transporter, permease and ATP-binding protein [Bifidobacterium pullorum subsp. saeculare DSM 6531 = LMG 14934]|uniref:ABC transporter, permease and ATP-binding protein n=2 Tax=Bifidobacterium pullorum TaxID=78448 RepID=A0A087CZ78_9BIFI|nr:ABC transporter ATP-binding protein [Bifidobacterium pullorum]KFI88578.1 ABC transporter, permease and ATP-binding protein [Bifidobacterium pullorum subsp. saeculare DSM 6531 = LMG 14934]MBM6695760.1 ABC transporter ATP-binding protein [Bifidobacterium pullorum subsp. saeculare]MBM6730298.1 ABC transporter ATP-binding protein [Bifidobacterium pullorum subsp. saeculare]
MYVDPNRNQQASNLRWILPYCKPDLPRVLGAVLLFIVNDTMALIIPLITGVIVDQVITGGHADMLTRLCLIMIVFTLIRVGSRYGYQMFMERFGQNTIFRLVSDQYEKLHQLDFTYFNHTRVGDIMSRMTSDTDAMRHFLSWTTYNILDCVVMFVGAICVMFAIDWRLALALACVTPFIWIFARQLSSHARPLFLDIRNSLASLNSMVEENIEGNRVVKAFVREDHETEKFDERNDDYMQRNMAQAYNSRRYLPWLDGCSFSLQLITLVFGGWLVINGYMTLGNLVSFNSFLWMIDGPVRQFGWLLNDLQRFNASCVKIRRLLTAKSRIVEKPDAEESVKQAVTIQSQVGQQRAAAPDRISGEIRFDHVSFAFPDDPNTPILKDIDFFVPAGTKLGILGETGAGKSTLVNLISRFYDPTVGHVVIDGIDARDWPLTTLRSQVCVVAQDTFLFSDTIGGNIAFGAGSNRDENYIRRMAAIAGADGFIRSMPEGYNTVVGERGVGLSGGQKQRLSLARALADDPAILIMDDTTSAVDMETEAEIQRHLKEMGGSKTIITIAHRISSIKDADLILVLEHGQIVERGDHASLVKSHGRYWEIYKKQLGMQSGRSQGYDE